MQKLLQFRKATQGNFMCSVTDVETGFCIAGFLGKEHLVWRTYFIHLNSLSAPGVLFAKSCQCHEALQFLSHAVSPLFCVAAAHIIIQQEL